MSTSVHGFKNMKPTGRTRRKIMANKNHLEKSRLANRKEGFKRCHPSTNPIESLKCSAGYLSESDRLHTDTSGEQKAIREFKNMKYREKIDKLRTKRMDSEKKRWEKLDMMKKKEEERAKKLIGTKKKNKSLVGYDLITLNPKSKKDIPNYKYEQKMQVYNGSLRAQRLYQKSNRSGFNPITGQKLPSRITIPPMPVKPDNYKRTL